MTHTVQWTHEKVSAFWEVNHLLFARRRFSQQVGPALRQLIHRQLPSGVAAVVDFGCGDGTLLHQLRDGSTRLVGTDFKMPSGFQALVGQDLAVVDPSQAWFVADADTGRLDGYFDAVLLIEVVEHLDDDALAHVLGKCRALLKPQGVLMITTPNDENMPNNTVNCPDCGCVFHRVQHVRAWTTETLTSAICAHGLRAKSVYCTDLGRMQRRPVSRWLHTAMDRLDKRKMPHLVGLFQRV
jgi:2-polyprenyl-3-methyl-5-hydroxy-6-metoxy-1,4-benzoquinol methylase